MIPDWLTGFPYSVLHSLNLDWLLKKVASIDPSGFVRSVNNDFKPDPETGNLTLGALNIGALPINEPAGDARKLGGKAPEYYLPPMNLLDNSNFRNPVNQRGLTSYTAAGYTIDRWISSSSNPLTVGSAGITLDSLGSASTLTITQYVAGVRYGTYTLACCTTEGTTKKVSTRILAFSGDTVTTVDGTNASYEGGYISATYSSKGFAVLLRSLAGYSSTFEWVALYEGAYTAETLPPYVPKGYAVELAECQRYFLRINCKNKPLGFGHAFTNEAISILIPTPASMSTAQAPTITFYDNDGNVVTANAGALVTSGGQLFTPTAVKSDGVARENGIITLCTVSGATNYETADLYCNGVVDISVEP